MSPRRKILAIERLERRELFAAFSVPWPEVDSLRMSFVADGTQVGTAKSELFRFFETTMPEVDWQLQMLAAFQTWAIQTNANVGLVADQGQPVGTIGFKQGDLRFGDIRVGAFPMGQDVIATANPYDPFIANTWVGDVFLNSASSFLRDADDPAQALLTVMLHESGHVFGIDHNTDANSPMYPYFQSAGSSLTPVDIAKLKAIYGPRKADRWEDVRGNQSIADSTVIRLLNSRNQRSAAEWSADIGSHDDIDTFAVTIPSGTDSLSIELHAKGKSLLTANLAVLNELGQPIKTEFAVDPRSNNLAIEIPQVREGEKYHLQIRSADESVFGIGAYELKVTPLAKGDIEGPSVDRLDLQNLPTLAPEELLVTTPGYVEHTYYEIAGVLTQAEPSQLFRFHSPKLSDQLSNVFTIVLAAETGSIDNLGVFVTDADGNEVPMSLISVQGSKLELQVVGALADADYLATVYAKDVEQLDAIYEIEVDFAHDGRLFDTLLSDTLSDAQPVFTHSLSIGESGQYHFVVSASDWSDPHDSLLEMRVLDSAGQPVAATTIVDGSSQWLDLFLSRGRYTVEFTSSGRLAGSQVLFQLSLASESSPVGPQLRDMSSEPIEHVAAPPIESLITRWLPGYVSPAPNESLGTQYSVSSVNTANEPQEPTSDGRFRNFFIDNRLRQEKTPSQAHKELNDFGLELVSPIDQQSSDHQPRKRIALPKAKVSRTSVPNDRVREVEAGKSAEVRLDKSATVADPLQQVSEQAMDADSEEQVVGQLRNHVTIHSAFASGGISAGDHDALVSGIADGLPDREVSKTWQISSLPESLTASILAVGLVWVSIRRRNVENGESAISSPSDQAKG